MHSRRRGHLPDGVAVGVVLPRLVAAVGKVLLFEPIQPVESVGRHVAQFVGQLHRVAVAVEIMLRRVAQRVCEEIRYVPFIVGRRRRMWVIDRIATRCIGFDQSREQSRFFTLLAGGSW